MTCLQFSLLVPSSPEMMYSRFRIIVPGHMAESTLLDILQKLCAIYLDNAGPLAKFPDSRRIYTLLEVGGADVQSNVPGWHPLAEDALTGHTGNIGRLRLQRNRGELVIGIEVGEPLASWDDWADWAAAEDDEEMGRLFGCSTTQASCKRTLIEKMRTNRLDAGVGLMTRCGYGIKHEAFFLNAVSLYNSTFPIPWSDCGNDTSGSSPLPDSISHRPSPISTFLAQPCECFSQIYDSRCPCCKCSELSIGAASVLRTALPDIPLTIRRFLIGFPGRT